MYSSVCYSDPSLPGDSGEDDCRKSGGTPVRTVNQERVLCDKPCIHLLKQDEVMVFANDQMAGESYFVAVPLDYKTKVELTMTRPARGPIEFVGGIFLFVDGKSPLYPWGEKFTAEENGDGSESLTLFRCNPAFATLNGIVPVIKIDAITFGTKLQIKETATLSTNELCSVNEIGQQYFAPNPLSARGESYTLLLWVVVVLLLPANLLLFAKKFIRTPEMRRDAYTPVADAQL
jgi:hypothetical protein